MTAKEMAEEMEAKKEAVVEKPKKTKEVKEVKQKEWIDVFKDNYEGKSDEAKSVEPFLKKNYKGNAYLPWATMERLTYMCDPMAKFTIIHDPKTGGIVHTDTETIDSISDTKGVRVETHAQMFSHFVVVALEFMGKVFIEEFPIQEQDYSAAKVYNANLVNKALQRAKAKVAARGTGLGLALYEGNDLQFDEVEEPKKPELPKIEVVKEEPTKQTKEVVKTIKEVKEVPKNEVKLTDEQKAQNIVDGGETKAYLDGERTFVPQDVGIKPKKETKNNGVIGELVELIKGTPEDKLIKVFQQINRVLLTKYKFVIATTDTDEVLIEKFSKLPDPSQFKKGLEAMIKNA